MVDPETFFIVPDGHSWRLYRNEQAIDVSFVDLGAAFDAAIQLGAGRPFRIILEERSRVDVRAA
ncbi:MAG: hypothetical protein LC118_12775 [Dehalococcoidia bacterium]|nr:hypothetical protein [Dehalococcoidia bacterium]